MEILTLFFLAMNYKILFIKHQQNYGEGLRASILIINSKQGGSKPTSKHVKTLVKKDHLTKEWAVLFAPLGIQIRQSG